jgi:2'-phosphotransferase
MSRARGGGGHRGGSQPRPVTISKALSRLLRHAAVEEHIPIDSHGYVRMDHLLGWRRLRSMSPPVSFAEIVEAVQESDKKRFALKFTGPEDASIVTPVDPSTMQLEADADAKAETETQRAISHFECTKSRGVDERAFFVRATQGHSMKAVEAENLLTLISLDDPASVPGTVVHGTFYGAWERILLSGGLKSMGRNHVHFATGPSLQETLPSSDLSLLAEGTQRTNDTLEESKANTPKNLSALMDQNKVISGMRRDAQILVYIDVARALAEAPGMKWWRSENGVVLTDGLADPESEGEKDKVVPARFFLAAVEVKEGLGLLYTAARGTVRELPERLRTRGVPRGKGGGPRGGRGRGRG